MESKSSKKQKPVFQAVLVILTFLFAFYGVDFLREHSFYSSAELWQRIVFVWTWQLTPVFLVSGLLFGFSRVWSALGLNGNLTFAMGFALLSVLPMFVSSALLGEIPEELNPLVLVHKTLLAGFGEEVLFRGFFFGLLFRNCGWGFLPASLLGALFFGVGHLYQGSGVGQSLGIFFVTAIGAAWYAWLYIEWRNNLWVPIFLHVFMNFSWTWFEISPNALGGMAGNIFRIATIAIATGWTISHCRKSGFWIQRANLFRNFPTGEVKT